VVLPALVAAGLLALAGGAKLFDPTMTAGALRVMGLPSAPGLVRVGAAAEVALGVAAVVVGGPVLWGLVALSYAGFAVFVVAALASGRPIGTCGCFGRADTRPTWWHVALDCALGIAALAYALA
jgi:hypothetical protein